MFVRSLWPRSRLGRTAVVAGLGLGGLYLYDMHFQARAIQRNLRACWTALIITADYKLNFNEDNVENINALHFRVAKRIRNLCAANMGLYIKFGQNLASMNHILPKPYLEAMREFYDEAPTVSFSEVVTIFKEEFNKHPDELFSEFDRNAIASASIAQVHRAKLKDGTPVAVKVQKPYIRPQLDWDMAVFRFLMGSMEYFFDIPMVWTVEYTEKHLRQETDFLNEAKNAAACARDIAANPHLQQRLHVPKVFDEYTTPRVMTAEWVDGIKLKDVDRLKAAGFDVSDIMKSVTDLLSYQIFFSGRVHSDPHVGNLIVFRDRNDHNRQKVSVLDHGLYIEESEQFRHSYASFWQALYLLDVNTLDEICRSWGVSDSQLFASMTLLRPFKSNQPVHLDRSRKVTKHDVYQMQLKAKEKIRTLLENTKIFPRELLFIGRVLNILRANNKELGSPINRINVMVQWAVRSLGSDWSVRRHFGKSNNTSASPVSSSSSSSSSLATSSSSPSSSLWSSMFTATHHVRDVGGWLRHHLVDPWTAPMVQSLHSTFRFWFFQFSLSVISAGFYLTHASQKMANIFGYKSKNFEELIEGRVSDALRDNLGIEVNAEAFES